MEEAASRQINYLRMSVTDRCQLRCVYCTYWQEWQKRPPAEILRYEELLRLAAVAAEAGVRKIRITGGEPLVRRGLVGFLQDLNRIPGIDQVCLTTNGVLLRELAPPFITPACATSMSVWIPEEGSLSPDHRQ
jgi:cyclic pyranopterin phosphate synthase